MAISFLQIPIDLRVPGQYVEFDSSRAVAGLTAVPKRALIIGPRLSATASVAVETPVRTNRGICDGQFGVGSFLAEMVKKFQRNNEFTELWAIAAEDLIGGVQAVKSVAFSGTATEAGSVYYMVAGRRYNIPVANEATAATVSAALNTAINADGDALVTSVLCASANTVYVTVRNDGTIGNTVRQSLNYGELEQTPAGLTVTPADVSAGAGVPDIQGALDALTTQQFHYIVSPYNDSANLTALEDFLATRAEPLQQIEGIGLGAAVDSLSNLVSLGTGRNSQFTSIFEVEENCPTPDPIIAAGYGAVCAFYLSNDPARPLQTLEILDVLPAPIADRFTLSEQNTLLYSGISVSTVSPGGRVAIGRAITTYQQNAQSVADPSYLDLTTTATLFYVREQVRIRVALRWPRHKLADDTAQVPPGSAVVRPKDVKFELLALMDELIEAGIVESVNPAEMVVERNASDPNRIDALLPPNLVNGFQVFAGQVQFIL